MKYYAPNYYNSFHCIASACRHSCCVGWEINIDEDSLARYQTLSHPYGETLRQRITQNDSTACFALDEKERCPFLKENGLCEMILTLGEDALCQICRDHPRFYNLFSDREEVGIGLCCEEAARIVLQQRETTEIILLLDDGEEEDLWEEEQALLTLRDELFVILQNRTIPFPERINQMLQAVNTKPVFGLPFWHEKLSSLEQLDKICLTVCFCRVKTQKTLIFRLKNSCCIFCIATCRIHRMRRKFAPRCDSPTSDA